MPIWALVFMPEAEDDFKRLEKNLRKRISGKLNWLQVKFGKIIPSSLGGEWRGFFKFRVGDYRVIYRTDWNKKQIIIYAIGRRDKVYKRKLKT